MDISIALFFQNLLSKGANDARLAFAGHIPTLRAKESEAVACPRCGSGHIIKFGTTPPKGNNVTAAKTRIVPQKPLYKRIVTKPADPA